LAIGTPARRPMTWRHQFRSAFGWRSADGAAAEVSLDVDGVCDVDELLLSLGAVVLGMVVDGLVAGVAVVLESSGLVAESLVACA
jgi:hypothetical protein